MGIWVNISPADSQPENDNAARYSLPLRLEELGLQAYVTTTDVADAGGQFARFQLRHELANEWAPDRDTTLLCQMLTRATLKLDPLSNIDDLEREILLAMLLSPSLKFPSHQELASAVRIRKNIVLAARKTTLDFHTTRGRASGRILDLSQGSRLYDLPGKSLITALQKATQPAESGQLYSFSCYRATEYVILLGIAQELETLQSAAVSAASTAVGNESDHVGKIPRCVSA